MSEEKIQDINELGSVRIADEVVAIISGLASTEVEGVAGMSGGIAGGIAEILGRKNLSKGVKVKIEENETFIDLYVIADYGTRIHEVAKEVQEKTKSAVENMTGLNVTYVNVHIQGIKFKEEQIVEKEEDEAAE
ncbi:Asp23/Gls24 family envelope stress response protein [Candidatus Contubernalis alkaliaceticus]|uniref:Asp23/Gls24 family envelope stress response protein n=1 Tax=Candidatus Contubernalis alkaliaceticus TaxID=338645 RepID=UPI001F4C517A|nr:Asp23/Gls24 family envelope stress response protein [Candidatus Contubernalis alkalaceticus]UNC92361.1 Asp23/Gls24 family envelope stress response protein [Candidatus Contubernalis alkalaceticus]